MDCLYAFCSNSCFSSNLLWFLASKLVLLQRLLQASSCSPPLTSTSRTNKAIRAIWTNNFILDTFYLILPVCWLRGPLWPNWCTDLLATNISCNFAMQYQLFFLGIFRQIAMHGRIVVIAGHLSTSTPFVLKLSNSRYVQCNKQIVLKNTPNTSQNRNWNILIADIPSYLFYSSPALLVKMSWIKWHIFEKSKLLLTN